MTTRLRGYKWTRVDGTSWHDPTFGGYVKGATLTVPGAREGDSCGVGLHFSLTVQDAIGYGKYPGALWRVESDGPVLGQDKTKARVASLRVMSSARKPSWVREVERVIAEISDVPWFRPHGPPDPNWRHFTAAAWDAATVAAWDAARDAVRDAARDAAWDAARATARDAAMAAAWDAARAAARDAARAAAWDAQKNKLIEMIEAESRQA